MAPEVCIRVAFFPYIHSWLSESAVSISGRAAAILRDHDHLSCGVFRRWEKSRPRVSSLGHGRQHGYCVLTFVRMEVERSMKHMFAPLNNFRSLLRITSE